MDDTDLADLTDAQQVALLVETTNDLDPGDENLPQPPQDPAYHADEHRLGRIGGSAAGEPPDTAEARARRRASLPLDTWEPEA